MRSKSKNKEDVLIPITKLRAIYNSNRAQYFKPLSKMSQQEIDEMMQAPNPTMRTKRGE